MLRKAHIITLAVVAASIVVPVAQAGSHKPDPLAVSWMRGHGYSAAQIAAATGAFAPAPVRVKADPLAVSWMRGHGYSEAQIAAMIGGSYSPATPAKVDPLAVSYLRAQGLTPSEITDWTVGVCSRQTRPASCFAVFDRTATTTPGTTSVGFDWGDAGIGAAATLGIVLFALGLGFTLITRGRRPTQPKHA
jgi:hypothetical protein